MCLVSGLRMESRWERKPLLSPGIHIASLCWMVLIILLSATGPSSGKNRHRCPTMCICTDSHKSLMISCIKRRYTHIPDLPLHTTDLEMSFNNLTILTDTTFQHLDNLLTLRLDYNQIHNIESGAFSNLQDLTVLHLHNNRLTHLHPNVFLSLRNLQRLYLNHNAIAYLHPRLFYTNVNLRILDIRANIIKMFKSETFQNMRKLTELHLSENPFKHLPYDAFHSLSSLTELNIASTDLEDVHPDSFISQSQLLTLDISDNDITELQATTFRNLTRLQYLNLSGNPFHCDCRALSLKLWVDINMYTMWTESNTPKCVSPRRLSGIYLHLVSVSNLTCSQGNHSKHTKSNNTKEKVNKYKSRLGKVPYNPLMGWYTAASLTGMLVLFLICVVLDHVKRRFYKWRRERRKRRKELYQYCSQTEEHHGAFGHKTSLDGVDSVSVSAGHINMVATHSMVEEAMEIVKRQSDDITHAIVIEVCDHSEGSSCNHCTHNINTVKDSETSV